MTTSVPSAPDANAAQTPRESSGRRVVRCASLIEFFLGISVLCLLVQLAWPEIEAWRNRPRPGTQVPQAGRTYPYLIYLPAEYDREARRWPLLVFLHGSGERGSDLNVVTRWGPPKFLANGRQYPMIVVAPQCPADRTWNPNSLVALLDELNERFSLDPDRIYLTGYSMGGFGAWELAAFVPERLAAVVPVSGGGKPTSAPPLKNLPVWAFHGAVDETVPVRASQEMIEGIRAAGGHPRLTIYPDSDHGICDRVYQTEELFDWLLSQRRGPHATD